MPHGNRWPSVLAQPAIPVGSDNRHAYLHSVHLGVHHVVVQCAGKPGWHQDVVFDNVPAAWACRWFGCELLPDGERQGHQERFGRGLVTTAKLKRALVDRCGLLQRPVES